MNKLIFNLFLILSLLCLTFSQSTDQACWKRSYGRGVGKPISTCPANTEQNGLLCYPLCNSGYSGNGPVCWEVCPSGFKDTGADCLKPSSYGRGAGYALWNEDKCNNENSQGCEKYGALYYPKCAADFHNAGCCICSPNCPPGWTDIGVSCQKGSYGRGVGKPLVCTAQQQEDAGLCYNPCRDGYYGVGPVCWESCPSGWTDCGAMCVGSSTECADKLLQIGTDALNVAAQLAGGDEEGDEIDYQDDDSIQNLVQDLDIPICS